MSDSMAAILAKLDSLEDKTNGLREEVKELAKLNIQMVRNEEKVANVLEQNTILFKKYDGMIDRITRLEKSDAVQKKSIGAFERFGWIVIGAVSYVIGAWFK